MSNNNSNNAVARLVQALNPPITGNDNDDANAEASMDLASRMLESKLGGSTGGEAGIGGNQFSVLWKRRIQNQWPQQQQQQQQQYEVEQLYQELTHHAGSTGRNSDQELPAKIMTVLTKCAGKAKQQQQQQQPSSRSYSNNNMMVDSSSPHTSTNQLSHALQYEEQQILRELLYALQGIEGERIKFYSRDEHDDEDNAYYEQEGPQYEGIRVLSPALQGAGKFTQTSSSSSPKSQLGSGAMDALRICGEAGWLVRRLQHYVNVHLNNSPPPPHRPSQVGSNATYGGGGQVARALARSVAQELQAYHDCLARWEEEQLKSSAWSLRQWLVQIQRHPILQRLTVLAMLTEALPSHNTTNINSSSGVASGGTLLSALHAHSLHGDSRHKSLVQSILYPTSQPWFHMLYLWTTQGLLPASWGGDFFVTLQSSWEQYAAANSNVRQKNNSNNRLRQNNTVTSGENKYLWHDKYTMDKAQIPHPGIFDPDLVRPAFVVGKGINFIRTSLNQVGWTLNLLEEEEATRAASATGEENKAQDSDVASMERLGYHYVADPMGMHLNPRLTRTLLRAEKLVHSHILQSLRQDHNLLDHLYALKQFLFHGQGDFFSSLLEGLYSEFGCGTKSRQAANLNTSFVPGHAVAGVYPQQLLDIMETALRRTNAKDLPVFCVERLRVEMLPFEPDQESGHGLFTSPTRTIVEGNENENAEEEDTRTVWDIFMLDYTVPDPLVAIVHEKALEQYKSVYSFLFGLRKVEYMLHRTWRQSATLQHALQRMAQNNGLQTSSSVGYAHATVLLRKISMTRQAMTHFCVNLKSYCMLEVLEGGWKELQERLQDARTLDEAIEAHDYYLESICRKMLLSKGRKSRGGWSGSSDSRRSSNKFRQLFDVVLSVATDFCSLQERLFDEALEAAERVSQRRREAEQRMTHGQWGFENEQDLAEEESFFGLANASELAEVVRLSEAFDQCMQTFLSELDAKVNGRSRNMSTSVDFDDEDDFDFEQNETNFVSGEEQDVDSLRFLIHQLDHNHYYGLLHGS